MAKMEKANIAPLGQLNFANISNSVGLGEVNDRNDVMLIQAMFRLLGDEKSSASALLGMRMKDLPDITGIFDEKTIKAIWIYQRHNSYDLLKIDGKVHPGSYQGRIIKKTFGARHMMITHLNFFLRFGNWELKADIEAIAPNLVFETM